MRIRNERFVNKTPVFCALFILLGLIITSCQNQSGSWQLVILEPNINEELYRIEVAVGSEFDLSYRHSVSGSMVYGTFYITDEGKIQPLATSYSSFGPGLPLDSAEEYKIANGKITVHHREEPREIIRIWVSPITEESISIDDQNYPLYSETESHRLVEIFLVQ